MKPRKRKPKATNHNPAGGIGLSHSTDLSQASLEQALIEFSDFCDKSGKRIVMEPVIAVLKRGVTE